MLCGLRHGARARAGDVGGHRNNACRRDVPAALAARHGAGRAGAHKDIDLFGFGFLSRLTGEKAQAKEFLDQRKSRTREIKQLAMLFAISKNSALSENLRLRSRGFPMIYPTNLRSKNLTRDLPLT